MSPDALNVVDPAVVVAPSSLDDDPVVEPADVTPDAESSLVAVRDTVVEGVPDEAVEGDAAAAAVEGAAAAVVEEVVWGETEVWWFATTMPALSAIVAITVNVHDAIPLRGCSAPLITPSLDL